MGEPTSHPVPEAAREVTGVIERVIADVPAPRTGPVPDPAHEAERIVQRAARQAAMLSGGSASEPDSIAACRAARCTMRSAC